MVNYMPLQPNFGASGKRLAWEKKSYGEGVKWVADIPGSEPDQTMVAYQPDAPPARAEGKPLALLIHDKRNFRICHHFGYYDSLEDAQEFAEKYIQEVDDRTFS